MMDTPGAPSARDPVSRAGSRPGGDSFWLLLWSATAPLAGLALAAMAGRLEVLALLGGQEDTHGAVKGVLLLWQSLVLLRGPRLMGVLLLGALAPWLIARGSTRGRGLTAALGSAAMILCWRAPEAPLAPVLGWAPALLNAWPWRLPRAWLALPGLAWLLPGPALAAWSPHWGRRVACLAVPGLLALGVVADARARFGAYERELLAPWPDPPAGGAVTRLASSPAGMHSDFHDLDLFREPDGSARLVIVAETQRKLLTLPSGTSAELPPWWGPMEGLVMDSETDPESGLTWALDGPHALAAWKFGGGVWTRAARSVTLPRYVHHAYTVRVPPGQPAAGLYLFGIGLSHQAEGSWAMRLPEDLRSVQSVDLVTPERRPLAGIRDVLWVPPLERFVLVPDMGEQLWTWAPGSPVAMPWLRVSTRNGKPTWNAALGEILLPAPERTTLWRIDPVKRSVRAFPTQPGVRAAAVDSRRGLVWTASVLTGAVAVQRLQDGELLAWHGGLMPMFRTLVLDEASGEAWVGGWRDLWRIRPPD